jgi:hypothetical protein
MTPESARSFDWLSREEESVLVWIRQVRSTLPPGDGPLDADRLFQALLAAGAIAKDSAGSTRRFQRDGVEFTIESGSDRLPAPWLRFGGRSA